METIDGPSFHISLANYFAKKPLYLDEPTQKKPNTRKLVEQPWQQTKGRLWDEVTDTLCNLDFIQAKAAAKMTYELVNDFNTALEGIPDNQEAIREEKARQARMDKYTHDLIACAKGKITRFELKVPETTSIWTEEQTINEIEKIIEKPNDADKLKEFYNFLGQEAGNLQSYAQKFAHFTTQQAWNYALDGPVGEAAENSSTSKHIFLLLRNKSSRPECNPKPQILKTINAGNLIYAVSITPDAKKAIISLSDYTCILLDMSTGETIYTLKGHTQYVRAVAMTPDSKWAISGSEDGTCIVWDLTTGKAAHTLRGHSNWIYAVAITPDGKKAISGSQDHNCILWDLRNGELIKTLKLHEGYVTAISITPDGNRAISGSEDQTCILWDLKSGKPILILKGHSGPVVSLSITADGTKAISGSIDKSCIFWDLISGKIIHTLKYHKATVRSVSITPDGIKALSCSQDHSCILWDLKKGQVLRKLKGHTNFINSVSIIPDGSKAISGSRDETCILWDLKSGVSSKSFKAHMGYVSSISIPYDKKRSISGASNGSLVIRNLSTGEISTLKSQSTDEIGISKVHITPDNKRLFTCSFENPCSFWNIETGKLLLNYKKHTDFVIACSITPDGKMALTGSWDKTCILWDLLTGKIIHVLQGHTDRVYAVTITPDGKRAISCSLDKSNIIWDLATGMALNAIKTQDCVSAITISLDGRRAFTGSWGENICLLWNLKERELIRSFKGHTSVIYNVSFTPDNKKVITASSDKSCIIWDLTTGEKLAITFNVSEIRAMEQFPGGIILGGYTGELITLNTREDFLCSSAAITSIRRIWDYDSNSFTQPFADCPLCGNRFEPSYEIIQTILQILKEAGIKPSQSPCLELPDEAWEHPGLLSECPSCHEPLKYNPFFGSDQKGIEEYLLELEKDREWETVFKNAEQAFKEQIWEEAFKLYLKLISAEKFDASYMRYNMALCRINGLTTLNRDIIENIILLIRLLQEKGENEKAQLVTEKLKERLDLIKEAEKPWWKKMF